MIDKFDLNKEPEDELDGVLAYVCEYAFDNLYSGCIDASGNPSYSYNLSSVVTFKRRYNEGKIGNLFKYEDYLKKKDIQETLKVYDIDVECFWYLILFIYDYSFDKCITGIATPVSPNEQLRNLINAIKDNSDDSGTYIKFNKEAKLTFSIKGKHNVVVDSPDAISWLSNCIEKFLDQLPNGYLPTIATSEGLDLNIRTSESNIVLICYFAKMFQKFFNGIKDKRSKKGSTVNCSKLLLISRLLYFTRITTNEEFEVSELLLKGYINKYKDYQINGLNRHYL